MKCPVCSHVYPDALSRCSQCGRVAPDGARAAEGGSTLIEFPSAKSLSREDRDALPDWRVELNEKVRAIKARRSMEARVEAATAQRQPAPPTPEPEPAPGAPAEPHANPIVAAALTRVRRASENAARATAAAVVPAAPARPPVEATRVLALPQLRTAPAPAVDQPAAAPAEPQRVMFDPSELLAGFDDLDSLNEFPDDPITALADVRTCDDAPLFARALGGLVDAAVLCVASAPFVAAVLLVDGNFANPAVQILLVSTIALLSAFYLFVTLAVGGRTVGMAYSHTRVVQAETGDDPTPLDALLRVLGYFAAALPAGLGLLWAAVAADRRGWHDRISGTRVVEE